MNSHSLCPDFSMTIEKNILDQELAIGRWRVVPESGELRDGANTRRIEPKVMQLLTLLADRSPAVVSKDEIIEALWPDTVVGDDALARCLLKLRRALGDDAKQPEFIETLPRRGYRMLAPIERIDAPRPEEERKAGKRPPRFALFAAVLAVVALAAIATLFAWPTGSDEELPLLARAHDHYYQFEQADNERAHLLYQRVLEERPDESEALAGLANTLVQRVIRWPEVGGPVPEPERSLRTALERQRADSPWAQATLARALELAERAVALAPESGFSWKAHGLTLALRRQFDAARESYARALDVDPDNWEAAVNLGDLDLIEGRPDRAVAHFVRAYGIMESRYPETAQRIGPWQPEVGVLIGQLYRELGDDAAAERWFRRVLGTTPLHVDATLLLAASRAEDGDEQEAETLCRDLVSRIGPLENCRPYLPER